MLKARMLAYLHAVYAYYALVRSLCMHVHMMTKCSKKHGEEDCSSACMRQLQQGGHVFILFLFENHCQQSCCRAACILQQVMQECLHLYR